MCRASINSPDLTNDELIEAEKSREKDFIQELKQKLDELEHYAAASGSLQGLPTSVVIEKQKILIDQLRSKLDLQLDDDAVSKLSCVKNFSWFFFVFSKNLFSCLERKN